MYCSHSSTVTKCWIENLRVSMTGSAVVYRDVSRTVARGRGLSRGRGSLGFGCAFLSVSLYFTLPADWGPQIQCPPDRPSGLNPVLPRYVYKWHDGVQAGWDCNARNGPKVLHVSTRSHSLQCHGALQRDAHSRPSINQLEPRPLAWDRVKWRRGVFF